MHDGFDDELVVAGDVEEGAAGPGVGQLDQGLVAQGILGGKEREKAKGVQGCGRC